MSESNHLRKQLDASAADVEALRRQLRKLRSQRREELSKPIVYRRDIPHRQPASEHPPVPPGRPIALEEAVDGAEVSSPLGGKAYLLETRPTELEEQCGGLAETFIRALGLENSNLRRRLAAVCGLEDVTPEGILFVDLETTGLMGTPLFLIGTMDWADGDFEIRQYLARDYSEEPAVISLFLNAVARKHLLVTFNGKAFDLPYIRLRAAANNIPFALQTAHFDLLHECRRVWRDVLPDCRLQTLESRVCGRPRGGDIPGEHIGEAYHAFVRTGNAAQMVDILRHNSRDLITMADLMVRLTPPSQGMG